MMFIKSNFMPIFFQLSRIRIRGKSSDPYPCHLYIVSTEQGINIGQDFLGHVRIV